MLPVPIRHRSGVVLRQNLVPVIGLMIAVEVIRVLPTKCDKRKVVLPVVVIQEAGV